MTNDAANDPTTINAAAPPSVSLVKSVSPNGTQLPGTDLVYTIVYTNTGGQPANNFIIIDPNPTNVVPAERVFHNDDFKVGSMTSAPGTSGLVATFSYSNDGGTTWTYTPVSAAGGAPAGYDRVVTNVRWAFAGTLSQTAPNNTGNEFHGEDCVVRDPRTKAKGRARRPDAAFRISPVTTSYCITNTSSPIGWFSFMSLTLYSAKKAPCPGISRRCVKLTGISTPSTSINFEFSVPNIRPS